MKFASIIEALYSGCYGMKVEFIVVLGVCHTFFVCVNSFAKRAMVKKLKKLKI